MKIVKVVQISFQSFSDDELRRLQANLRRRFQRANVVDVAFGQAYRNGTKDHGRSFCVCFFVRRKRNPRDPAQRIPRQVTCRLKQGSQYRTVKLPTDVIQTRKMNPSGRKVRRANKRSRVTTGCVVSWKEAGQRRRKWGIVTVGHYFPRGRLSNANVFVYRTSTNKITGEYLFRSARRSKLDLAVASFEKQHLVQAGLVPQRAIPNLKPRSIEQLKSDIGKQGKSLIPPRNATIGIQFDHYFPENDEVDELGIIKHVVRVKSSASGAFKGGRSGTIFRAPNGQAALIQFAGTTGAAQEGLGQACVSMLEWLTERLAEEVALESDSVRLISIF